MDFYLLALWGILLAVGPVSAAYRADHCEDGRTAIVQLFEWRWTDVATECEDVLQQQGYCGVLISPPNEHAMIEGGSGSPSRPWWERYEPVSYILQSRSGTEAELRDMVERCNNVGIRVYADAVINHLTDRGRFGLGTAGTEYDAEEFYFPGIPFARPDVNTCSGCSACCCVREEDWGNSRIVRNCQLHDRLDLNHKVPNVVDRISDFLNSLVSMGVAGFRVDSATHIWPSDLELILVKVNDLNERWFAEGSRPFVYNDVIEVEGGGVTGSEYAGLGRLSDYQYGPRVAAVLEDLSGIPGINDPTIGMPSEEDAVVFVDNHITQRNGAPGGDVLNYKQRREYIMATAVTLGYGTGFPMIMSSYEFEDIDVGPPYTREQDDNRVASVDCDGSWVCEHRWTPIVGMVDFARSTQGRPVTSFWSEDNMAAWAREGAGFIAMSNNGPLQRSFQTGLLEGSYCDVITGSPTESRCSCTGIIIEVDADGIADIEIEDMTLPIAAFHIGSLTENCTEPTTAGPTTTPETTTPETRMPETTTPETTTTTPETTTPETTTPETTTPETTTPETTTPETTTPETTTSETTTPETTTPETTTPETTTPETTTPETTTPETTTPETTTPETTTPETTTEATTTVPWIRTCPDYDFDNNLEWSQVNGMCYALYRQMPMTAPDAEAFCVGLGGHLASIGNFQEDKYVTGLGDAPLKLRSMWIGLYWNTEVGEWLWYDGSNYEYRNWNIGRPDNAPTSGTHVELQIHNEGNNRGKWEDIEPERKLLFVCKQPIS